MDSRKTPLTSHLRTHITVDSFLLSGISFLIGRPQYVINLDADNLII